MSNSKSYLEDKMKKALALIVIVFMAAASVSYAGVVPTTQVSKILENKASLVLTDSQVKKLEIVEKTAQQKMMEARVQADIRLTEIERFTSNWTNMNSQSVSSLVKEYFGYLEDYKMAELGAIIKARAILEYDQLSKFQQLVSIQTLMLHMEQELAIR
jgi:hypothetical protein